MRQQGKSIKRRRITWARPASVLGGLLALMLLFAAPAFGYQQVGNFGGTPGGHAPFPEEVQLGGVDGLAVNSTGAGGVPAGTIYAISQPQEAPIVSRYNPNGTFSEAWRVELSSHTNYERCGPEGDPAYPTCPPNYTGGRTGADIEVDQTTGNVYVVYSVNDGGQTASDGLVKIYNPTGSKIIAHFAQQSTDNTVPSSANPAKLDQPSGLAVANDGTVYVAEMHAYETGHERFEHHRIMVFKPETPGEYEKYVYTGESHDVASGFSGTLFPRKPQLDAAGNIYGMQEEVIVEYNPSNPSKLICRFNQPDGGINAVAVNQTTGEVFYTDYKDKSVHELSACNSAGKFVETGKVKLFPPRKEVGAMAFDPARTWSAGRVPGVLYVASPEGEVGKDESGIGYIFAPPLEFPPQIAEESASAITSESALLHGTVNPEGHLTRYVFQYISEAAYNANPVGEKFLGAKETPVGGALVEGTEAVPVSAAISGLVPDSIYHFRVVGTSNCSSKNPAKVCEGPGADEFFRTYPVEIPGLLDRRAYELVSPVDKEGGEVVPAYPEKGSCSGCKPGGAGFRIGPLQSAPDGESVVYAGTSFSHVQGGVKENEYYARRTPEGWETTILSPTAQSGGEDQGYDGFNPALTSGTLYLQTALTPEAPAEFPNLFAQATGAAAQFTPLLTTAPPNRSPGRFNNRLNIVYAGMSDDGSRIFFTANDALTGATANAPAAVEGGSATAGTNLYEWNNGQVQLVNVAPGNSETAPGGTFGSHNVASDPSRQVSADGSRVFWTAANGKTYVREAGSVTREIPDPTAEYLTASRDGGRVLMSDGTLYSGLGSAPFQEADLTNGQGGFKGVAGQSEDLSRIYFVAESVLDGTPNGQGSVAEVGKNNLYLWNEGAVRFIAQLSSADGGLSGGNDWGTVPLKRTAEASPDGRWFAFASQQQLTGFKYVQEEVYLYDTQTGQLSCPSCNRGNSKPLGSSYVPVISANVGQQPRYLSNSGRVFFNSSDRLVPRDTNGIVEDVYEFEPAGVGTCERGEGCVSLISAGTSLVDSDFSFSDESGKDVFFTSRDQLVPADKDDLIDLYDAREDGGIPAQSAAPSTECQGEACQPIPQPPIDPTPGASTFDGPGNLNEKKPEKGKTKKHKHKKHKQKHKKHGKKNAKKSTGKNKRGGSK